MAVYWDTSAWTGATLAITVGITESWVYDTEIGKAGSNLYHVAEDFKAWANDAARSWSGGRVFDYTIAASGLNVAITLTASGTVVWTANSAMQTAAGIAASTVAASVVGTAITHGLSASYSFRSWVPFTSETEGSMAAAGSFWPDSFAGLSKFPEIVAKLSPEEAYAEGLAIKQASTPRAAVFYDYVGSVHRHVYVSNVQTRRGKREIYTTRIEGVEVVT